MGTQCQNTGHGAGMSAAPGLLALDYDRIISQWGDGSVFACDAQDDTLGELLQQLEEDDTDTRWLESADESSSSQAAQQQQQRQAGMLPQTSQQQQHQQQKRSFDEGHATAAGSRPLGGFEVRQQPQVRPPWGWECGGGAPAVPELMLKDDSGTGSPFDAFSPFTTPQLSGRTTSSEAPCIVPDTAIPPPPPLAGAASFGLVPQMMALPPPPHGFMCMPMPPPMMAMPRALVPPTMCQAMPEVNDMQRIRQECLKRYREKKARRMYTKMVRYQLRKINADKRPRIKGRFVKKTEEEMAMASSRAAVAAAAAATKEVSESMSVEDCLSDDDASL